MVLVNTLSHIPLATPFRPHLKPDHPTPTPQTRHLLWVNLIIIIDIIHDGKMVRHRTAMGRPRCSWKETTMPDLPTTLPPTHAYRLPVPTDPYQASASMYDLMAMNVRGEQVAALKSLTRYLFPQHGPILDIGAGSGLNTAYMLEHLPGAEICALEPSAAMRSLFLARLATRPEWFPRVTIRPEDFFSTTLPREIGGAVILGVLGHFDPGERAALFAELADRLDRGSAALIDLQAPERPVRIKPYEFSVATIGELSYRGIAQGWPIDDEQMRWEMTYLTLEGERVLIEDTAEYTFRHPHPETIRTEASNVGLALTQLDNSSYWLLQSSSDD